MAVFSSVSPESVSVEFLRLEIGPLRYVSVWSVVGRGRGSLPSQASKLARGAAVRSQSRYRRWDLLERKERLQLEQCSGAWKPVARCSGEGWGFYGRSNSGLGGFLIGCAFHGLSQVNWFGLHLYWGRGTILGAFCSSAQGLADPVSFFRMQKCSLQLPLRMQEWYCSPWEWATYSSALGLQTHTCNGF
jgi:hypothetical protein